MERLMREDLQAPRSPSSARKLKVYVAGRYEDQADLRQFALDLEREMGWLVISSWLWSPATRADIDQDEVLAAETARACLTEIRHCDMVILDTGTPTQTGGREFEAGFAHALGKIVVCRGPARNIFHTLLPEVHLGQDAEAAAHPTDGA